MDVGTLVFEHRPSGSSHVLLVAAAERGLRVVQLTGPELPDDLRGSEAPLYSGLQLADRLSAALGIVLLEAPPDWLAGLPQALTRRDVVLVPIGEAYGLRRPVFVKSPNDKHIPARLYADGSHLPGPDAVDPRTPVLVSDPVRFVEEFRLHVLDGVVHAASQYAEDGRPVRVPLHGHPRRSSVLGFARDLLSDCGATLPSAVVVDVGVVVDLAGTEEWVVIEANGAWGSGCYAADPDQVLDVVLRASGPPEALDALDLRFVRSRDGSWR